MDYKFLNKVIDQLVSETRIDYDRGVIESPFFSIRIVKVSGLYIFNNLNHISSFTHSSFIDHCRDVYGLNIQETEYVWKEYVQTIIDKINNGL